MQIIALLCQKGGAGKTTLSLNLAIAAAEAGRQVIVIDLDPQQSAVRWTRLRRKPAPVVVSGHAPNLSPLIEQARGGGADLVILDTAPKSESAALVAAKAADLLLIPCQPSNLDLDAVADTVNIARLSGKPAAFVLNLCRATSALADQAEDALTSYKLPIVPVRIGNRVAFIKSFAQGLGVVEYEPRGSSAKEINQLYKLTTRKGAM